MQLNDLPEVLQSHLHAREQYTPHHAPPTLLVPLTLLYQVYYVSSVMSYPGSGHIFRHSWPMDEPLRTLSERFWPSLTISDLYRPYAIICQPWIAIVNSHNHSPHVCEPPAMLRDKFRSFPTLLSLKFWLSFYSNILPVSLQLSGQLLAQLCSLQSHDHLPSIAFVSRWTSEPF